MYILPVNFVTNIWNCENSPRCFICNHQTESVAHVVNSCAEFKNFYSRHHNRVVEIVQNFFKECQPRTPVYMDKLANFRTFVGDHLESIIANQI